MLKNYKNLLNCAESWNLSLLLPALAKNLHSFDDS